jgi:hypothetical protein|tara:strand:+ start:1039 stop:1242 length:204 start_codon:yes stop_codon:yes gene_type:complete
MSEEEKATITVGENTYDFDDISQTGQILVRHITSIRKDLEAVEYRVMVLKAAEIKLTEQLNAVLTES